MYLVDGLAYNQAQNNSLNWHWSNLYHRCCISCSCHLYLRNFKDHRYQIFYVDFIFLTWICSKYCSKEFWKHFKIFSFAGVRWGSHKACVKFFTVNEKYISRIWPIFLHAPHNSRQRLRWGHTQTLFSTSSFGRWRYNMLYYQWWPCSGCSRTWGWSAGGA